MTAFRRFMGITLLGLALATPALAVAPDLPPPRLQPQGVPKDAKPLKAKKTTPANPKKPAKGKGKPKPGKMSPVVSDGPVKAKPTPKSTFAPVPEASALPPADYAPYPRGSFTPTTAPTPKPTVRAPWVLVAQDGTYPAVRVLRYGQALHLVQPPGRNASLHLVAVNPVPHGNRDRETALGWFPMHMSAAQKIGVLGEQDEYRYLHWVVARGPAMHLEPQALLGLYEHLHGQEVGYLWPMHFLFYVAVSGGGLPKYHKLVIHMTR